MAEKLHPCGKPPLLTFRYVFAVPKSDAPKPAFIEKFSLAVVVTIFTVPPTEQSESIEEPPPFCSWIASVASANPIQLFQYMLPEVRPEIGIPFRSTEMFS